MRSASFNGSGALIKRRLSGFRLRRCAAALCVSKYNDAHDNHVFCPEGFRAPISGGRGNYFALAVIDAYSAHPYAGDGGLPPAGQPRSTCPGQRSVT